MYWKLCKENFYQEAWQFHYFNRLGNPRDDSWISNKMSRSTCFSGWRFSLSWPSCLRNRRRSKRNTPRHTGCVSKIIGLVIVIKSQLTCKLFKSVYMSLVYGQTEYSARSYIKNALDLTIFTKSDAAKLANALYRFWKDKYPAINNLMSLVNGIGWLSSFKQPSSLSWFTYNNSTRNHKKQ